jgi:transcription antitermination protein NusB
MHKKRRASREKALQILYAIDIDGNLDKLTSEIFIDEATRQLSCVSGNTTSQTQDLAFLLIQGVHQNIITIDALIEEASDNWKLSRLSIIDRNLLRIAVFEMLFVASVPPRVAINEAIEIAKLYGSDHSPKFINGILDRIYRILKSNGLNDEKGHASQ